MAIERIALMPQEAADYVRVREAPGSIRGRSRGGAFPRSAQFGRITASTGVA